jgi:mono/diheme cytochrome c family protein
MPSTPFRKSIGHASRASAIVAAPVAIIALTAAVRALAGNNGQDFSLIQRGRYLTIAGDCAGCHTKPGGPEFAGGLPIETPFGNVVAPNITPDNRTGIGTWTDDDFVRALTKGIRRDGAHLYPAMPYPFYTKVTRSDLRAIHAYLATVPAVSNAVHADQLPFPLKIRAGMAAWNKLFFRPGEFRRVPGKGDTWNRGAYLAEGLMHCGACHTPKNIAGADKNSELFQGFALQGWFAPDITNDRRRGLGAWSIDDVATYLKTGHNRFAAASGPMADEVSHSSSKMTDADLRAVATWFKDQPAPREDGPPPIAASEPVMKTGAAIYADECTACHTPRGTGIPGLFPALAGAPAVQSVDPTSAIRVVLTGARSVATAAAPTAPAMPGFAWLLDDRQTAAVLTYIRNAWGNAASQVSAADVSNYRGALAKGE